MGNVRKAANLITGLFILGGILYCADLFVGAESRMRQACGEIAPGMSVATLRTFAKKHGMNAPRQESGVTFLAESMTFGRWSCRVVLEKGVVRNSEYNFAD